MSQPKATWEVAREALEYEGVPLHYSVITDYVLKSRQTLLGSRGKTPVKSVGTILRSRPDIFMRCGSGYYDLKRRILKIRVRMQTTRCVEACDRLLSELRRLGVAEDWEEKIQTSVNQEYSEFELHAVVDVQRWGRYKQQLKLIAHEWCDSFEPSFKARSREP